MATVHKDRNTYKMFYKPSFTFIYTVIFTNCLVCLPSLHRFIMLNKQIFMFPHTQEYKSHFSTAITNIWNWSNLILRTVGNKFHCWLIGSMLLYTTCYSAHSQVANKQEQHEKKNMEVHTVTMVLDTRSTRHFCSNRAKAMVHSNKSLCNKKIIKRRLMQKSKFFVSKIHFWCPLCKLKWSPQRFVCFFNTFL